MRKLPHAIFWALLLGFCTLHLQDLAAQSETVEEEIIIIEKTTDANGNKVIKKIVTKGSDISEEEIELLIKEAEDNGELEKHIEIHIDGDDDGDAMIWHSRGDGYGISQADLAKKPTLGIMLDIGDDAIRITNVIDGSGAQAAGLTEGDILKSIDGQAVSTYDQIQAALSEKNVGDRVRVVVIRDGMDVAQNVELKQNAFRKGLIKKEKKATKRKKQAHKAKKARLGVTIEEDGEQVVVGQVHDDSAAARAGLMEGDVITSFNGTSIRSYMDLASAVKSAQSGQSVQLEYMRDGQSKKATVTFDPEK